MHQQFAVLQCNLDQKIECLSGDRDCHLWEKSVWEDVFSKNMVVVCTAEILYQCLLHSFIPIEGINLMIFDEAHHAKKNHAYARIVKEFYAYTKKDKRPKIFGMTASPVDSNEDPVKAATELESVLDCRIATASDLSLLRLVTSRPSEAVWIYKRLELEGNTALTERLISQFPQVSAFATLIRQSRRAKSELGDWSADQVWKANFYEKVAHKLERKHERLATGDQRTYSLSEAEIRQIRMAKDVVQHWPSQTLRMETTMISPKVLKLIRHLEEIYERPTDTKCIIFVRERYTAHALRRILEALCTKNLRPAVYMGTRASEIEAEKLSLRQRVLALDEFRKGTWNCLLATSVAEEGIDIADCNYVIRFDLYETMIQYVQSRGRARHKNSKFVHMVEDGNEYHKQLLQAVTQAEEVMKQFCAKLPNDRLLNGNDEEPRSKFRGLRKLTVAETGATLTYNASLVVLAHFMTCLPQSEESTPTVSYYTTSEGRKFVSEVFLPENSPLKSAIGLPCQRKMIAKQSAAFEACCQLYQGGHLDTNLLPTYHKQLPKMRNAHLAITSKKQTSYDAKIKPDLWAQSRGSIPTVLFVTVLEIEHPEKAERPIQPIALLTRTPLPSLPPINLFVSAGMATNAVSTPLNNTMSILESDLEKVSSSFHS